MSRRGMGVIAFAAIGMLLMLAVSVLDPRTIQYRSETYAYAVYEYFGLFE